MRMTVIERTGQEKLHKLIAAFCILPTAYCYEGTKGRGMRLNRGDKRKFQFLAFLFLWARAASMNDTNSGWGFIGRDLNSG